MTDPPHAAHRGRLGLYALAFVAVLAAGAALVTASLDSLQNTRLLWISAGLSYLAMVLAVLSLLLPRREG